MGHKTSVTFVAAALALLVGNAAAIPYTFTNIVDSSGGYPSLNNSGTVAFFSSDNEVWRILAGSGGPTTTLYDKSGPLTVNNPRFSFNGSGRVAFSASDSLDYGEPAIVTVSGDSITTIANNNGPFRFFVDSPSLNNRGTVAFVANDHEDAGIFTKTDQDAPPLAVGRNERSWGGLDAHAKIKGRIECRDGVETSSA